MPNSNIKRGINVKVFGCLFDYLHAEKDIEVVKKVKKGRHRLLFIGTKTEHSILKPDW